MIRFIKGRFHPGLNGEVIVETASGMGFEVHIPANSALYKKPEGDEVKIFTSMIVKEDDISLYGFSDKESLALFEVLITVNGVGAKAAMSMMSCMPTAELKRAIGMGDVKAVSKANGVGKKTAERIILELKEKVGSFDENAVIDDNLTPVMTGGERSEAVAALMTLGYSKNEAVTAVGKVVDDSLTCEDYIKQALKNLF